MSAASFCRNCGKALTEEEKAIAGNLHCKECAPQQTAPGETSGPGSSYQAPPPYYGPQTSQPFGAQPGRPVPGLAFGLGFIPGVGAIYNGQYVKGLVHAVIFGAIAAASDKMTGVFFIESPKTDAAVSQFCGCACKVLLNNATQFPILSRFLISRRKT